MRSAIAVAVLAGISLSGGCEPPGYGKHPTADAAGSGSGPDAGSGSGAVDAGVDSTVAKTCDHAFRLDGHGTAQSVWLTGDFVHWAVDPAHGAVAFTLGVDGGWTGDYKFMAGTFQYKFVVDGNQWIPDPTDTNTVPDGFGGTNSVYTCSP